MIHIHMFNLWSSSFNHKFLSIQLHVFQGNQTKVLNAHLLELGHASSNPAQDQGSSQKIKTHKIKGDDDKWSNVPYLDRI